MEQLEVIRQELRALREGAGLSRRELAERIGITQMSVGRIERGITSDIETMARLAGALGCQIRITLEPSSVETN